MYRTVLQLFVFGNNQLVTNSSYVSHAHAQRRWRECSPYLRDRHQGLASSFLPPRIESLVLPSLEFLRASTSISFTFKGNSPIETIILNVKIKSKMSIVLG